MLPVVTAFYAGLNALILVWLTFEVVARRRRGRISLGDGDDPKFAKVIRGHGNAAETIPIALTLLALTELMGAPGVALHAAGLALTVGRLAHALHFTGRAGFQFRPIGMVLTLLTIGVLAIGLVVHALAKGL